MIKIRHAVLLGVVGASCLGASEANAEVKKGIVYAKTPQGELALDVYLPKEKTSDVLLVHIHGGAWRSGSRKNPRVRDLVKRGYALASVDYRLSTKAKFPANVHDLKAAIRFLRANQDELGVKADKVVVMGISAGGHLAALVGVSNKVEELEGTSGQNLDQSSEVQGIVSFFGASNLETILKQSTPHGLSVRVPALKLLLGDVPEKVPDLARLASPVAHVDKDDPPLLLIHGDLDPQMPVNQSLELQSVYESKGCPVTFINVHGGEHGGPRFFDSEMMDRVEELLKVVEAK
ncbi:alpha/beta fold hydrolase [Haloferula sp.]|uniref:alpha/beta fold hydrolase n=1 Tax=Haloferula sp. TaxID=2497595 RepID=UPI00329D8640